jgi:DNA-binding PadR family transcriptional regulator
MPLTKVGSFMLFSLGLCYEQFESRFADKPFSMEMSKADFIKLMQKAKIAHKKDRALYKNLQDLEEKKFIAYNNKSMTLTAKGHKVFLKIRKEMEPYLELAEILQGDDILHYVGKKQMVLR